MPIVINTPALPSDQTGMDLSVTIVGIDDDGGFDGNASKHLNGRFSNRGFAC